MFKIFYAYLVIADCVTHSISYYEMKEFEVKLENKKPGILSDKLKVVDLIGCLLFMWFVSLSVVGYFIQYSRIYTIYILSTYQLVL